MGAETPGMGPAAPEQSVRAHHAQRMGHGPPQLGLIVPSEHHQHSEAALGQQCADRFGQGVPGRPHRIGERTAFQESVGTGRKGGEEGVLRAGGVGREERLYVRRQPGPYRGVPERLYQLFGRTAVHPSGQAERQVAAGRHVRVGVESHVHPPVAGGGQPAVQLLRPEQVRDMHGCLRLPAHPQGLLDPGLYIVSYPPDVRRINPAVFGRRPGDGDQLFGRGVPGGEVVEACLDAGRPLLHDLAGQILHAPDLGGGGRTGIPPHRLRPHRVETHLGHRIDGYPPVEQRQVFRGVGPFPIRFRRPVEHFQVGLHLLQTGRGQRRVGEAVRRQQVGGDSLPEPGFEAVPPQQRELGMGVDVDESGADHRAADVHRPPRRPSFEPTHLGDAVSRQAHISPKPRPPGPVHHGSSGQQPIQHVQPLVRAPLVRFGGQGYIRTRTLFQEPGETRPPATAYRTAAGYLLGP